VNGEERAAALDALIADHLAALRAAGFDRRPYEGKHRSPEPPSITCPVCGATSYHPADKEQGYCGRCHGFTSPPGGSPPAPVSYFPETG